MLLGRFTHVLSGRHSFRESEAKDRTDEDFEILQFERYEPTDFGQRGDLQVWCGTGNDFDWDRYDLNDDSGMHVYFFGFQNFLEFYTSPTKVIGLRKFVLYIPRNDWSGWEDCVVEEFEYEGDQSKDEVEDLENLLVRFVGKKYQLKKVTEESLKKYLSR